MKHLISLSKFLVVLCMVIGIALLFQGVREKIALDQRTADFENVVGYYTDMEPMPPRSMSSQAVSPCETCC